AHVVGCSTCAERVALLRAMRLSLKRTAARRAPEGLAARMHAVVAAERERALSHQARAGRADLRPPGDTWPGEQKLLRLRYAVGLAAAAGVVSAMGMPRSTQIRHASDVSPLAAGEMDTASTHLSIDALLEELIALHARPFPPDTTDPDQLERFDPFVGVQMQ